MFYGNVGERPRVYHVRQMLGWPLPASLQDVPGAPPPPFTPGSGSRRSVAIARTLSTSRRAPPPARVIDGGLHEAEIIGRRSYADLEAIGRPDAIHLAEALACRGLDRFHLR